MLGLIAGLHASEQRNLCGASLSGVKVTSFPQRFAVMFVTCRPATVPT
jgi:hypothetical protein